MKQIAFKYATPPASLRKPICSKIPFFFQCDQKMSSAGRGLNILFFPFMAPGHMLPMVNIAKLFAARGTAVTFLTTPANSALIRPIIDSFNSSADSPIHLRLIPFPSAAVGLPEGCENLSSVPFVDGTPKLMKAIAMLRHPFDLLLKELCPDCIITDYFFPWTYEVAAEHGIPRIVFDGFNLFAKCAMDSIEKHKIFESLLPESESVILPGLPHHIEILRSQLFHPSKMVPSLLEVVKQAREVDSKSYGLIVNSFYELEMDYVEHYRKVIGTVWTIGPVALFNKEGVDMPARGGENRVGEECLKWLDGRKPRSVVYLCFGTMAEFIAAQLREMAIGLEASGHPFVWVVRSADDEWIPEGYEERIKGRGILIKEFVPQLLILNHEAVGSFVTHCGWNSSLEGIAAGLPMGTWPLYVDQFLNERLLVDVLKVGVAVGSKVLQIAPEERPVVNATALETAVRSLMGEGEEAEERRRRARELIEVARKAVEKGGSSYNDLENLMLELMEKKKARAL